MDSFHEYPLREFLKPVESQIKDGRSFLHALGESVLQPLTQRDGSPLSHRDTGWNVAPGEAPDTAANRKQMMSRK